MKFSCLLCPNGYDEFDDFMHHMEVEHFGISSDLLEKATNAREIKKEMGNYLDSDKEGAAFECPLCFEFFTDLEKLGEHGKIIHNREFHPEFLKKLASMHKLTKDNPPICEKCNRKFTGLVTTRMENKVQNVCFDCYEKHFGLNALRRLTIGTPDKVLDQMRKPITK